MLKNYCKVSMFLNILTFVFVIGYFVVPINSFLLDFLGALLILSWLFNIVILYISDTHLNKNSTIGKQLSKLAYRFITFFIICIVLILIGVLFLNLIVSEEILFYATLVTYADILVGVLGIAVAGSYYALKVSSLLNMRGVWSFE